MEQKEAIYIINKVDSLKTNKIDKFLAILIKEKGEKMQSKHPTEFECENTYQYNCNK